MFWVLSVWVGALYKLADSRYDTSYLTGYQWAFHVFTQYFEVYLLIAKHLTILDKY
jgi:hypothetical protein